jgi:hypothetical protein
MSNSLAGLNNFETAQSANLKLGNAVVALKQALSNIQNYQVWLAANGAAGLEALPAASGGAQILTADAANIISAYTDLNAFASVYAGTETVSNGSYATATGYNFDQFSKQLAGINTF